MANPCFGLDFLSAHEVRGRLMEARNRGAAVLLISEDLDELLLLSDRISVMFDGELTVLGATETVPRAQLGVAMAGGAVAEAS